MYPGALDLFGWKIYFARAAAIVSQWSEVPLMHTKKRTCSVGAS